MPSEQRLRPAKLTVDFTGVEEGKRGGSAVHVPPGDYILEITDYEQKYKVVDGKPQKDRPYLNWKLKIVEPEEFKGRGPIYHVTSLVQESLWNLRNFLSDMGLKVPSKATNIPLAKLIGRKIGATLEDDTFDNKTKSKIAATFAPSDLGGSAAAEDEDEDETDVAVAATSSDDDEDLEELELDDL